jgi:hypothetical protein
VLSVRCDGSLLVAGWTRREDAAAWRAVIGVCNPARGVARRVPVGSWGAAVEDAPSRLRGVMAASNVAAAGPIAQDAGVVAVARRSGVAVLGMVSARVVFAVASSSLATSVFALGPYASTHGWRNGLIRSDAVLYARIAASGYHQAGIRAFFPGYPLIARVVDVVVPATYGTLIVSWVALYAASLGLATLATGFGRPWNATRTVLAALTFPTSIFLVAGYSEATFLAALVWGFVALARDRWALAACAFAVAGATEKTGVAAGATMLIVAVLRGRPWRLLLRRLGWSVVAFLGAVQYSFYLWARFGDPLAFATDQKYWDRVATLPFQAEVTSLYRLVTGGVRIIGHEPAWNNRAMTAVDDVAAFGAVAAITALAVWASRDPRLFPLAVHGVLVLIIGFSTAPYAGVSPDPAARIVMAIPGVYLVAGRVFSGWRGGYFAVTAMLAVVIGVWFNLGYWVT